MHTTLLASRITYIGILILVGAFGLLSETDMIPTGYIKYNAQTEYMLHMLCVILTLGGTWSALRLFTFKGIRNKLNEHPNLLQQWNIIRICMLGTPLFINLIVYYALLSGSAPMYCFLITLFGFVFCWPKEDE